MLVSVALPAERQRIRELLTLIPPGEESKTKELLRALKDLWGVHPGEKIVVFTTYLGSVDSLASRDRPVVSECWRGRTQRRRPRGQTRR